MGSAELRESMTLEQQAIEKAIRASDVAQYLVMVGVDPDRDAVWAKFRAPEGGYFTVQADSNNDSTDQSIATELIAQARSKISHTTPSDVPFPGAWPL